PCRAAAPGTMNKKTLTEQEIRTRFITPALRQAGWQPRQIREEYYFTDGRIHVQRSGRTLRGQRSFVDYLLVYKNVPLAIVEAKDNRHAVGAGMQQGLRYAAALDVPFVYSSNGDAFLAHNRLAQAGETIEQELPLSQFPSPEALWQRYTAAHTLSPAQTALITQDYFRERDGKEPRYYQMVAVQRALQAVARGQKRLLLVMATGTGKTFTAFQIIWRLWRARQVRRVLFLADRNILVDQTMTNDFKHFGDKMTKIQGRVIDKSYEIYLALYQGVSGSETWQNVYRQFSPDFFDLVIIDECHRGSAAEDSAWREVLDYFETAVQLGLTATPKETKYVSNIDYFGEPIYTYSLRQGIEDGFLAPYKVIRINVDKDVDGWMPFPGQTDKVGNVIEDRQYGVTDWDRTVVLEQRNELVARRVADYLTLTDPYAKTIVFCVDIAHAERMRQYLVNAIGPEAAKNRRYVMRITGDNPEGRMELDNFIDPEETFPVIATTSMLLTTGVDAQTCKVIVLDQVINSMTQFKQIIGRGTRLRPDLGKTHFTIIDFRNATRLFYDPQFDGEPVQSEEYDGLQPIDPGLLPQPDADDADEPRSRVQFVVDDVPVEILAERVQYYSATGRLVTKSFAEFSRDNVRRVFGSLDEFLQKWGETSRKTAVLVELIRHGVMLDELEAQIGADYDPFDLICHVAFDLPMMTRRERASRALQALADEYSEPARQVLAALLDKYAAEGVEPLEQAADRAQARTLLQLEPFSRHGTPVQITRAFGGANRFFSAMRQVSEQIYTQAA
ncbi:MAG: DEAD/DEAH box helicase family protein, partial [Anaerolineales bacterium]|nr:DEAD/DEAH box helicase family protein [Anaerolineales bacterium]